MTGGGMILRQWMEEWRPVLHCTSAITVVWCVTPCNMVGTFQMSPERGGTSLLRNAGICVSAKQQQYLQSAP